MTGFNEKWKERRREIVSDPKMRANKHALAREFIAKNLKKKLGTKSA